MFGPNIQAGAFIRFMYRGVGTTDPDKEVMVLHPNWQGKLHGIDLKRLTPAQVDVLHQIMDPETKRTGSQYRLVEDILRRMDPIEVIKNPLRFYNSMVRPFLQGADAYRQYSVPNMMNVQVLRESKVAGQVSNPAPLFRKPY